MKEFITDRLVIRRFKTDDWKDLYEYMCIPNVIFYEPYEVFNEEDSVNAAKNRETQGEESCFWAVCLKEDNKMIGNLYFQKQEPEDFMTWEIGYVFNPKYYGRGYATEASFKMLEYAFEELKAHRITAGVNMNNTKSWRLLERLKMRREGLFLQNVFFKKTADGKPIWHDSYRYGMLASEWFENKSKYSKVTTFEF
ncbi:ribosomal-protein-serine acetyltransferase [Clostridium zeae]|uniref:Ribosomal-protein-serine acetyltransferase n=1 Tax=Clostridium zeae TaxID=2759022 RepID=A0ABQ1E4V0_9CLOT|nr:GNAT family protein [Clostridium zeae]GFZ29755.1 ribosomal-protein-serine acetyltransferase [Clostridium zeae]